MKERIIEIKLRSQTDYAIFLALFNKFPDFLKKRCDEDGYCNNEINELLEKAKNDDEQNAFNSLFGYKQWVRFKEELDSELKFKGE